ncbi:MAG: ATP-grasp domain-containing protein [Ruminococcus sp.]|nr:ATP-grasp domain-containing protein [Ruminococcus sp.]
MKKFTGKTLLILGSNVGSEDIVSYAKAEGAYTIVADYYPPEKSSAKRIADKAVLISTADLEALDKLIEEYHVDGVLAGISEFNLLSAMELCRRHDMSFYCTKEQWDNIESKELFRLLCEKNNVPCPETYFTGSEIPDGLWKDFVYPVVLKPVDSSASSGVYICQDEAELKSHIAESISKSAKKKIIIEEYVKGNEFTAHYTISNGKASLACMDNRYPVTIHEGKVTSIPIARIFPSVYIEEYIENVNTSVIRLCESIGITDGIIFIQGIHNPDNNSFRIFEAGLRCAGEAPYRFLKEITGQNFLHIIVDHALLGRTDYDITREKPMLDGKCCGIVSFVAEHGIVGEIRGLEENVTRLSGVLDYENRYPVGTETPDTDTLRQLMIRFVMLCDNRNQMAEQISILNKNIEVLNTDGENMVIKFDSERLFGEF